MKKFKIGEIVYFKINDNSKIYGMVISEAKDKWNGIWYGVMWFGKRKHELCNADMTPNWRDSLHKCLDF